MIYDWFKVANLTEFLAPGLVSQEITLELEGLGVKEILITQGNEIGITYDGVFLMLGFNEESPFAFDGHACYLDEATQDIYLGIENES